MLFNTLEFGLFFVVVFALYYSPLLKNWQTKFLIAASFVFYSWHQPQWSILLVFSIVLNAFVSWKIASSADRSYRLKWAIVCVAINVLLLFLFKYASLLGFVAAKLSHSSRLAEIVSDVMLPVGISFYTFEGISLLVDSYKNRNREERQNPAGFPQHLKNTALFFSFFPHLAAGPIVRPYQFFPQIERKEFSNIQWNFVIETLIVGYFFKNVVADNLVVHTSGVLTDCGSFSSINDIAALLGYSARIFSDFAGYSLIAIGLAAALGYQLPPNFNFPYRSQSLAEFWHRWHITLSTWIRDYLYIPMGGNKKGEMRTYLNLIAVMFLGGLWHGGKIGFALWGLFHGVLLCAERVLKLNRANHNVWIISSRILCTFVLVTIAWLLFALPLHLVPHYFASVIANGKFSINYQHVFLISLFSAPVIVWHLCDLLREKQIVFPGKVFALGSMLFLIVTDSGVPQDFVYFQF